MTKRKNRKPKKFNPLAQREFAMTFDIDEVNARLDQWYEQSGIDLKDPNTPESKTPLSVVADVYHGDLIICLKHGLIVKEAKWQIELQHYYEHLEPGTQYTQIDPETGCSIQSIVEVKYSMEEPTTFADFRDGHPDCKVKRGDGLRVRWQGINIELNKTLQHQAPPNSRLIKSIGKVKAVTRFKDLSCYMDFLALKKAVFMGVAA